MTTQEIMLDLNDYVTFSGALPCKLNDKELNHIISNAADYFYTNYRYALEQAILVLPAAWFMTDDFHRTRQVKLSDLKGNSCIKYVGAILDCNQPLATKMSSYDMGLGKLVGAEMMIAPFFGNSMEYVASIYTYIDSIGKLTLEQFNASWNHNTKTLSFMGHIPYYDVYLDVTKEIPISRLYTDNLFKRYVRALAVIRMGQQFSFVQKFPMPGGIQLDYSTILSESKEDMKLVEESLREYNTPNFMVMS